MRLVLALAAVAAVAGGCSKDPKLVSVTPKTICANNDSTLTLMGSDLAPSKVELGLSGDMGSAGPFAASKVEGSGATVMATFAANSVPPSDTPYDLIYTDKNGKKVTLPAAVTVVPGISISAVDPGSVYNGVDFPTSVYGTGMGAVQKIQISMNGGAAIDLAGVVAVDNNRADAIVPMGTAPGTYDVTVVDSNGCTATLPGALTVTADLTVSVCAIDPTFGYDMEDTDVVITATMDGKAGGATCGGKTTVFASAPRAWLNVAGTLKPLANVAFVSGGTVTATVPKGLMDGGPYDLIVQDPDGSVGILTAAFKVVNMPVPQITSLDPPLIAATTGGSGTALKILGKNFRPAVKVELYTQTTTTPIVVPSPAVNAAGTEVDVTINTTTLGLVAGQAYVVRVTDLDQGTYGEFTALAIISSSHNVATPWDETTQPTLPMALMRAGAAAGQVSTAAHYLYVVGGDNGGGTPAPHAATQIATLDKYGNIGGWMTARYHLAAARTMLGVLSVPSASGAGGYLYAIGGYDGTAAVKTVSRAKILVPADAPQITKSAVSLGGTLARGTWYYRVAAVLDNTDVANPMGETLPSEEVTAHTVDGSKVTIEWAAVPKAATYRVYRTAMINGVSQDEVLLHDSVSATSFVDDGTDTAGTDRPLRQGEHGVWVDVASLNQARRSLGVALAHDTTGAAYLYALGGDNDTGYTNAINATAMVYTTYEYAALSDDGQTLGAWKEDLTNTFLARTRLGAAVGESATSPAVVNAAYVYVIGGVNGSLAEQDNYQYALVATGGQLGAFAAITGPGDAKVSTQIHEALATVISSDQLFALGGETAATGIPLDEANSVQYSTVPLFPQLNGDPTLKGGTNAPIASFASLVLSTAHIYLLGGTADGSTGTTRVWSDVF